MNKEIQLFGHKNKHRETKSIETIYLRPTTYIEPFPNNVCSRFFKNLSYCQSFLLNNKSIFLYNIVLHIRIYKMLSFHINNYFKEKKYILKETLQTSASILVSKPLC